MSDISQFIVAASEVSSHL